MKYFKKIKSERLYLSPINLEDVNIYTKWLNDYEVTKYIGQDRIVTGIEKEKEVLENMSKKGYNFVIVLEENDELIGGISFQYVNNIDKTAEIGLFIGEEDKRGHGYGPEAIKALMNYGFKTLNLQNIELIVYEYNEIAIKAYKKIGFKEYGRRSKSKYYEGKFYDTIYMEYLSNK
jgi:RimJ/RimL family protein N-acetyltransferase